MALPELNENLSKVSDYSAYCVAMIRSHLPDISWKLLAKTVDRWCTISSYRFVRNMNLYWFILHGTMALHGTSGNLMTSRSKTVSLQEWQQLRKNFMELDVAL